VHATKKLEHLRIEYIDEAGSKINREVERREQRNNKTSNKASGNTWELVRRS
jgi:hypothetical protein